MMETVDPLSDSTIRRLFQINLTWWSKKLNLSIINVVRFWQYENSRG